MGNLTQIILVVILVVIAVEIIIFLIFREVICWYWKINYRIEQMDEVIIVLKKIIKNQNKQIKIIEKQFKTTHEDDLNVGGLADDYTGITEK